MAHQTGGDALEDGEVDRPVMVQIRQPDDPQGAVLTLGDEDEIQNPDDALVDEINQDRQALAGHLAPRELHDQIADRPQAFVALCHVRSFSSDAVSF